MSLVDVTREFLPGSSSSSELGFVTGLRSCLVETIPKLSSASSSSTTSTSSKSLPYDRITSGRPDDTSAAALSAAVRPPVKTEEVALLMFLMISSIR